MDLDDVSVVVGESPGDVPLRGFDLDALADGDVVDAQETVDTVWEIGRGHGQAQLGERRIHMFTATLAAGVLATAKGVVPVPTPDQVMGR